LPGTTGWGATFGGVPTAQWSQPIPYAYTTNNGTISITGYTGSGGAVAVPGTINGWPVTSIGYQAFSYCARLTSITIPDNVTTIGGLAFYGCGSLASVTILDSVTSIGDNSFSFCGLTNVMIGNGVTSIGNSAFAYCSGLTSITIPASVISIGDFAFHGCAGLTSVYFQGNAPDVDSIVFGGEAPTVFYLPGTTGWGATFDGVPTAPWMLPNPTILNFEPNFGVQTNQFGFTISWATNIPVVVEACTDLSNPAWTPVGTNTLTDGVSYFSDSQWANYPGRYYRLRSP
jgi:hypothetical protein